MNSLIGINRNPHIQREEKYRIVAVSPKERAIVPDCAVDMRDINATRMGLSQARAVLMRQGFEWSGDNLAEEIWTKA